MIRKRKTTKDRRFMLRAIALAKRASGKTYPNPMVGAVIVRRNKIISEGYHKRLGAPHAETSAIIKAKGATKGASIYINLEPCTHYGRTPPCADRVIESGIKKVYVSMRDPNPIVNGKGLRLLKANGIKVSLGLCSKEAGLLNVDYVKYMEKKRVYGSDRRDR
ncbi:MAG: bifunctional diaminohydroxyphosphoribosylaminopyrimidine deaminase/5-amino-6-(5-phosphoribosylamino)uracil reductase RibD [Candidatus Omnitrophota bacterium]